MNTSPYAGASYVSWGAIFAGAALACALSVVMLQFGSAIGLSATNVAEGDRLVTPARVFGAAFWILWVQVLASLIGGYIAGRLRTPAIGADAAESEVRDGAHGLLVWATATLAVFAGAAAVGAVAALAPEQAPEAVRSAQLVANQQAVTVISAFAAAATSLVSAVAAWWAATKGGDHRDNLTDVSYYLSFRRR